MGLIVSLLTLPLAPVRGTVWVADEPLNFSHCNVVMASTPMLTTPMLLSSVVNALPLSSAYIV